MSPASLVAEATASRHSSFKTWSRLGVGDRLRGSHLDQDQVSLSSQPPVFPGLPRSGLESPVRYRPQKLVSIVSWVRFVSRLPIFVLSTPVAVLPCQVRK